MSEDGLLPCPFCGDTEDLLVVQDQEGHWFVECSACVMHGPISYLLHGEDNARAAWNRRTPDKPL